MVKNRKSPEELLSDSIRRLIDEAAKEGMTRYKLAKLSGVSQASISRFMSGERGLNTESLDCLARVMGWKIVAGKVRLKQPER